MENPSKRIVLIETESQSWNNIFLLAQGYFLNGCSTECLILSIFSSSIQVVVRVGEVKRLQAAQIMQCEQCNVDDIGRDAANVCTTSSKRKAITFRHFGRFTRKSGEQGIEHL
uniref:Uncharacterized protein n=1 Tax=Glossina austeni TaxID=7395 RepID=A0A1A9V4G3_GLOAU